MESFIFLYSLCPFSSIEIINFILLSMFSICSCPVIMFWYHLMPFILLCQFIMFVVSRFFWHITILLLVLGAPITSIDSIRIFQFSYNRSWFCYFSNFIVLYFVLYYHLFLETSFLLRIYFCLEVQDLLAYRVVVFERMIVLAVYPNWLAIFYAILQ